MICFPECSQHPFSNERPARCQILKRTMMITSEVHQSIVQCGANLRREENLGS